ncbi:MAG: hypothetical protein V3W44_09575 [Dehalococcoidales bacterium]
MALPQHIVKDVAGSITLDIQGTLPTAVTATLTTGTNAAIFTDKAGTISTADTTLSSAVTAGDRTIAVASATGVAYGVDLVIRTPTEHVRVKSVAATTATLWRPLLQDHASASVVQGTQVAVAVTAAQAATLFWDGRCGFTLDSVLHSYVAVECTKYPLLRIATIQDCYDHLSDRLDQVVSGETDTESVMDVAHEMVLTRIGAKARVRVFPGGPEFIEATALALAVRMYRQREAKAELYERYRIELNEAIDRIVAIVPRDDDQDGIPEGHERINMRSSRIHRA